MLLKNIDICLFLFLCGQENRSRHSFSLLLTVSRVECTTSLMSASNFILLVFSDRI